LRARRQVQGHQRSRGKAQADALQHTGQAQVVAIGHPHRDQMQEQPQAEDAQPAPQRRPQQLGRGDAVFARGISASAIDTPTMNRNIGNTWSVGV